MDSTTRFPRKTGRFLWGLAAVVAVTLAAPAAPSPPSYEQVTIDQLAPGEAGANGYYSVATQPSTGRPSIAAIGASWYSVVLMEYTGTAWTSERVAFSDSSLQGVSLAYDPVSGEPRVAFAQFEGGVKVAIRSGSTWTVETVDPEPYQAHHLHLLIPPSGSPLQVVYSAFASKSAFKYSLMYAQRTGPGTYTGGSISPGAADQGYTLAAAINPETSMVGIVYAEASTQTGVRFAEGSGTSWTFEWLPNGSVYGAKALTYASRGGARIPHMIADTGAAVWHRDGTWTSESPVPGTSTLLDIEADPSTGRPVLAYSGGGSAKLARFDGSVWNPETVGAPYDPGKVAERLTISSSGNPTLALFESLYSAGSTGYGVIHAERKEGLAYVDDTVQQWRSLGMGVDVVCGQSPGDSWISYIETAGGSIRLAHLNGTAVNYQALEAFTRGSQSRTQYTTVLLPEGGDRPWVIYDHPTRTRLALPSTGDTYAFEDVDFGADASAAAFDPITGELLVALQEPALLPMTPYADLVFRRRTGPATYTREVVQTLGSSQSYSGQPALTTQPGTGYPFIETDAYSGLTDYMYNGSGWSIGLADGLGLRPQLAAAPAPGTVWGCYVYSYYGVSPVERLLFRSYSGGSWSGTQQVASFPGNDAQVQIRPALVARPGNDQPLIVYSVWNGGPGELHIAEKTNTTWQDHVVASSLPLCSAIAASCDSRGRLAIVAVQGSRERLMGWFDLSIAAVGDSWTLYR